MILNAIWQVSDDHKLIDLPDRSIRVDKNYGEGLTWGEKGSFDEMYKEKVLLRHINKDDTLLVAVSNLPFFIEFWNINEDEALLLKWDGSIWEVGEAYNKDDTDSHTGLLTTDVEFMVSKVCYQLGLTHLTASQIRNKDIFIELVDRNNFSSFNLPQGNYFYRNFDSEDFKFVADLDEISLDEIDVLHYAGDDKNTKDDFIYIFYDDDLPIELVLSKLAKKKSNLIFETVSSDSDDIVDCINLVKDAIEFDENETKANFYIVKTEIEGIKHYRLFFNMASFYPDEAPFLI